MASLVIDKVLSRTGRGCVFTGSWVDGGTARFVADSAVIPRFPATGEIWRIGGKRETHSTYGAQIRVIKAELERPSGRLIIRLLSGERFADVGPHSATTLWSRWGEDLYDILDRGDEAALIEALGDSRRAQAQVRTILEVWPEVQLEPAVYRFLDRLAAPPSLARKLLDCYGTAVIAKLEENPYRLMAFTTWRTTDAAGRFLGIAIDDPRRLVAAVEAATYKRLADNHTLTPDHAMLDGVNAILRDEKLARRAIELAAADQAIVAHGDSGWQGLGPATMESFIASHIGDMLSGLWSIGMTAPLFQRKLDQAILDTTIQAFETSTGFTLNGPQRDAVKLALSHDFAVLTGGAGVGKTTVLKAIYALADELGVPVHQMALSGRAALRMSEATGQAAMTCAGWLTRLEAGDIALEDQPLIVIDEASMIDLPLLYRILRNLVPGCRLIMVGDPGQLPPVGFGLSFHILADDPQVPRVHLTEVMRQAAETGIPLVSLDIRAGKVPTLQGFEPDCAVGVSWVDAAKADVVAVSLDVLQRLGGWGENQIVGSTKGTGKPDDGGTVAMNTALHQVRAERGDELLFGRFYAGEPVIYAVNDYELGLMNGSLGVVLGTAEEEGESWLVGRFDRQEIKIPSGKLEDLDLAYAITTHKAQGSQFPTVIVPVFRNMILDRTMLYTAITRAQRRVVLVGDRAAFEAAIAAPPSHSRRQVGLQLEARASEVCDVSAPSLLSQLRSQSTAVPRRG